MICIFDPFLFYFISQVIVTGACLAVASCRVVVTEEENLVSILGTVMENSTER